MPIFLFYTPVQEEMPDSGQNRNGDVEDFISDVFVFFKYQRMDMAEHRYMTIWKRHLIKFEYSCNLSSYCRLTGTNYNGICLWLMRYDLSVSALKVNVWDRTRIYRLLLPLYAVSYTKKNFPWKESASHSIAVRWRDPVVLQATEKGQLRTSEVQSFDGQLGTFL